MTIGQAEWLNSGMGHLLLELINATLANRPLDEDAVKETTEADWHRCFEQALGQQVLAMTFSTMSALPKDQRPSFPLWSKWMAYTQSVADKSAYKRDVVKKMGLWLVEDGLATMIIKGFSLAVLYPQPELRESSDIDIYSGEGYESVNSCFERHGMHIGRADGHHVHINVDGVSVEHHFALHNSRVKGGMDDPVGALRQLAAIDRKSTALSGIYFPNAAFTALFTAWHAYNHFLQEKIELRHVIDWALALRQLSDEESQTVFEVKGNTPWGRFADTLTAISLRRLHLPKEWFPEREGDRAESVSLELEQRVWNDIVGALHTAHGSTSNHRRLNIAQRMMENGWKFDAYADMSARRFLWKEFCGWLKAQI